MADYIYIDDTEAALELAKEHHAVECRAMFRDCKPVGLAFFNCDAFAIGQYNPQTGILVFYPKARHVPFHERALMPVYQSLRPPMPNHTLDFIRKGA